MRNHPLDPPSPSGPTPAAVAVVCAIVSLCRRLQATILRQLHPPPRWRRQQRLTSLYDTIVSSRNCRRSHLSPFPLPCKHTPAPFPAGKLKCVLNSPNPDVSLLPPGAAVTAAAALFLRERALYNRGLSPWLNETNYPGFNRPLRRGATAVRC